MQHLDKKGDPFVIKTGREDDIPRLVEMYALFHPRGAYQGLPPQNSLACCAWIEHLFEIGINLYALRDDRIIGHGALLPDLDLGDGEYLVFVHQLHRGLCIGTALTRHALTHAAGLGLSMLWLTVDACNFIAIRLYRKCGFCFQDASCLDGERKMVLPLTGGHYSKC